MFLPSIAELHVLTLPSLTFRGIEFIISSLASEGMILLVSIISRRSSAGPSLFPPYPGYLALLRMLPERLVSRTLLLELHCKHRLRTGRQVTRAYGIRTHFYLLQYLVHVCIYSFTSKNGLLIFQNYVRVWNYTNIPLADIILHEHVHQHIAHVLL